MIANLASGRQVFTSNVFLVTGERTTLVDVGNEFDVVAAVEDAGERLDRVVLTHTHHDHVANLESVVEAVDVDVFAYDESFPGVDVGLDDGDSVRIGDHDYDALHTPGHKNDHLCLYSEDDGVLFAGDLIFANGSFGRTDLEEGHRPTLIESIQRVLDATDESLREMHTGHGPSVQQNPYHDIQLALQAAKM